MTPVERWNIKLREMLDNRNGLVPKDRNLEQRLADDMEAIFEELTPEERGTVDRPPAPRYFDRPIDLIALDHRGHLIGFEDCDC